MPTPNAPTPTASALRGAFDAPRPETVGLEEELMLVDPVTWDLTPRALDVLGRLNGDGRFKQELPAAQVEIAAPPAATVPEAAALLRHGRAELATAAAGIAVPLGAGVHPFTRGEGALSPGRRYEATAREYGRVARRQLVFGLHVHVTVVGADRAVAVYNALREHLPALAALGAGSPFYEGLDTGLASVRPKLSELLPRQGVPPVVESFEELADALAWGVASGRMVDAGQWWWEARLHPEHHTVEVRVPDAQTTVDDAAAIAAVVHALVATLADRHDAGELGSPAPTWRIEENRWAACRDGVQGTWVDVRTGAAKPMGEHLHELIDTLEPAAKRLGCAVELTTARDLVERPRAAWARDVARREGLEELVRRMSKRFRG